MKYQDDDNVGVTFSVILLVTALAVAGSLAAILMEVSGLADAIINYFA